MERKVTYNLNHTFGNFTELIDYAKFSFLVGPGISILAITEEVFFPTEMKY
jgi:hypothetical protein